MPIRFKPLEVSDGLGSLGFLPRFQPNNNVSQREEDNMGLRGKLLVLGISIVVLLAGGVKSSLASGLNGTTLWGVGSVASQMGGTGTAMPLDSLTATLRNPAGTAFFDGPTINLDLTVLNTDFHDEFDFGGGPSDLQCNQREYPLPNFGFVLPLKSKKGFENSRFSFGFALGVTAGGGDNWVDVSPLNLSALYEVFSAVFNVTYKITDELAIGAGPRLNWALLDLGEGHRLKPTIGGQVGLIYAKPCWSLGVSYIPTTTFRFGKVYNLDFSTDDILEKLTIQEPNQVYAGFSWHPCKELVWNLDGQWLGYGGCDFYKQIGWRDVWGVGTGVQYQLLPWLKVRGGYHYNNCALKGNEGWNLFGTTNLPGSGVQTPNIVPEAIRMLALPLYWKNHVGAGIGLDVLPGVTVNVGGTYSFEFEKKEWSAPKAIMAGVQSSLWSLDVGIELRF
jgi:hypothetical protein